MNKEKIRGIYKIINLINGKVYIGESLDIYRRWEEHKEDLNNNKHHSYKLQQDWNDYGADSFKFDIVEELNNDIANYIDKYVLIVYENKYIKEYNTINNGYNIEETLKEIMLGNKKVTNSMKRDKAMIKKVIDNINNNNGTYKVSENALIKRNKIKIIKEECKGNNITVEELKEQNKLKQQKLKEEKQLEKDIKKQQKEKARIIAIEKAIEIFKTQYINAKKFDGYLETVDLFSNSDLNITVKNIYSFLNNIGVLDENNNIIDQSTNIINTVNDKKKNRVSFNYDGFITMCELIVNNYKDYNFFSGFYISDIIKENNLIAS